MFRDIEKVKKVFKIKVKGRVFEVYGKEEDLFLEFSLDWFRSWVDLIVNYFVYLGFVEYLVSVKRVMVLRG